MKTIQLSKISAAMALGITILVACSKSDDTASTPVLPPLPTFGGFNSADEVGAADLVAYWPLNGDGKESKSSTLPTTSIGATFEAGAKGQGVKLTNGYMKYPSITSLTSNLTAYSISAWVKVKNNQTATAGSGTVSVFFSLTRPNEREGNINFFAETGQRLIANDSIRFVNSFRSSVSDGQSYDNISHLESWMVADNLVTPGKHVAGPNVIGGQWAQGVITWSGATHKLLVYSNGVKINSPGFEVRGTNTSIVLDTPTTPIIGAFGDVTTSVETWNKPMIGNLDEIRVWKKALTAIEVDALYQLEKLGR